MGIRNLHTEEIVALSRPLHNVDRIFTLPAPGTVMWRYCDYSKASGFLSGRMLYFRRADRLPDIYEGRFTAATHIQRSAAFADAFKDLPLGEPNAILQIQESHRSHAFLNCWHKNKKENPRMWREFTTGADSVAMVSNLEALFAGTPDQCRGSEVHYVDEEEPIPELHSLAPLFHKRRNPYAFEDEFRLIYVLPMNEPVFLDRPEDFFRLLPADPSIIIHELRLHPGATTEFRDKVRQEVEAAGLAFAVTDSEFAGGWPPHSVGVL